MHPNTLPPDLQQQIREMASQGISARSIGRSLGLDPNTVLKYIHRAPKAVSHGALPKLEACEHPQPGISAAYTGQPHQFDYQVKRWFLLPDMHHPEVHEPTWNAALNFMEREQVDGVTFTGDQFDLAEISHWNQDSPGLIKKGAFKANLDSFKHRLGQIDRLLPHAQKRWHRGNHERFVQDYYEKVPALEGMLDLEQYLELERRGYEIYKLGEISECGKLGVIHGDQVGSGMYIARKLVDNYCRPMAMGHVHTASSFTKVSASNNHDKWMGWTLPTMGTLNPLFARNRANCHVNGLGIVEVFGGGDFNLFTVITDSETGAFAYGGKVYRG